ncbi:MAG: c-type cytochrome, partial [Verrucomicrobiota bacterium]|nr:c-type cytochrome [Verrucomicrobiota bacterium]
FVQGLAWPTAVIAYDGGVFVGVTPKILYLKDTNGDGKADINRTVFEGFGTGRSRLNVQAMFNSFRWGLDNRIHGATSSMGGKVKDKTGKTVSLSGRNFSFNPRTMELRSEGSSAQHGMGFDDYGRQFICSNSSHIMALMYPSRYAGRNKHYAMPSQRVGVAVDGGSAPVFRLSADEPWRIVRTRWRVAKAVRGPVEGGGRVSGYFTAATGITIYRGDALGEDFKGNAFIADTGSNLIHRKLLHYKGIQPVARRPEDEANREFAASTDNWFRPVQFANAPDGCLYVADMYRETIEHPWSIPESIKKYLDLDSGNDRGRIWRIAPKGFKPPQRALPGNVKTAQLVGLLAHGNGWTRECASRLIYERQDKTIVPALTKLAADTKKPLGQIHALWTLRGLGELKKEHVLQAMEKTRPEVRVQAMILAEDFADQPEVRHTVYAQVSQSDKHVLYQLALTASRLPNSDSKKLALGMVLGKAGGDRWIEAAVMNAFSDDLGTMWVAMHGAPTVSAAAKLEFLKLIGRRNRPEEVAKAVMVIARRPPNSQTIAWVNALGKAARSLPVLEKESLRWLSLPAAEKPDTELIAAMTLVLRQGYKIAAPALMNAARNRKSESVHVAIVQSLSKFSEPKVGNDLLSLWPKASGRVRAEILAALMTRPERVAALLKALETKVVAKAGISASTLAALRSQKDGGLRSRVTKIFGAPEKIKTRQQVINEYLPALKLKGDVTKGKVIYTQRCATCHRYGKEGFALGPDLVTIKTTGREKILTNFIDPNREVVANYIAYNIKTKDGEEIVGLLGDETTTHVRVKLPLGQERLLPRTQVLGMRSLGQSIMPMGLEAGMTKQQMADLLEFITGL